jgi:hypothetical protein
VLGGLLDAQAFNKKIIKILVTNLFI